MSVLCIVPSALRASRAMRRLCDAEGGLLLDARIATLQGVATRALTAGDGRPVLTPLAERLLALECAAQHAAFHVTGGGLARTVTAVVAELRRGEVTPDQLRVAASDVGAARGARLAALAGVLELYERRLADLAVLDGAAAMRAAAEAIQRGSAAEEFRAPSLLVVDGFRALARAELDLVAALARTATRTHVRVPYFPDRADLCAPGEPLVRALEGLHALSAERDLTLALEGLDERPPRLAAMLRAVLGGSGAVAAEGAGTVIAAEGAGEADEAERAAELTASLLDQGFAAEDVIVVAAGPSATEPSAFARACAALGIPLATGRGRSLRSEPPVRAIRDAMTAAARPDRSALEAAMSSSYLGLARAPGGLRYWLDRAGALDGRGSPEEALRRRAATLTTPAAAPERSALLRAADALGAAEELLRPLSTPGPARSHASGLRAFVAACGVRRRAARGDPEVVRRDLAALARLDEVADDLVRAFGLTGRGGEALSAERWGEYLDLALDGASTQPSPEPAAGAVELWPLSDAPGLTARAAVLLGCSRGAFPAASGADALLGELERAAVNGVARRTAVASGPTRRAEARHAAFCALAAGREALALTWAGAGPDGSGGGPAPLAVEVLSAAGLDPRATRRPPNPLRRRMSAPQAIVAAARDPASPLALSLSKGDLRTAGATDAPLAAEDAALAGRVRSALARGAIERERRDQVASRRASRFSGAVPEPMLAEFRRSLPEEWTPSQLENHARCAFRFYLGTVLRLSEPDTGDVDIDPRDEGSLAHAILERFLRARLAGDALPLDGRAEERVHLASVAQELFSRFEADGRTGDPAVWAARRGGVLRRLERVIDAEARAGDGAIPALLEFRFGGDSPVPPLTFTDGDEAVRLRGRLDRVDAAPDRLVLIDYKDGKSSAPWRKKLDPEALGEVNFQVPAYLMAAARALPGRGTLEATYLLLRAAERLPPFVASSGDALFAVEDRARASARAAGTRPFADAVVSAVRRVRSGELAIASRDCAGCSFGAVCRSETRAEDEA